MLELLTSGIFLSLPPVAIDFQHPKFVGLLFPFLVSCFQAFLMNFLMKRNTAVDTQLEL